MAALPSYQEAVRRSDWLDLVAPYLPVRDYARLCRVSRSFYRQFAPRLWSDPLRAARLLGLHPNQDLDWYFHFMSKHARAVRRDTLRLVTSLDLCGFAAGTPNLFSERSIPETFRSLAAVFPSLRCIRLDGHAELDPSPLARPLHPGALASADFEPLLFLSVNQCRAPLPHTFFESPYLLSLVYLDVSDVPGSLRSSLALGSLQTSFLPSLRILKARGREMDDYTAILLLASFSGRVWSLDLSRNNLTDHVVTSIVSHGFPDFSLQSDLHFETEGRLALPQNAGSDEHGAFRFVEESAWSGTFSHPDRYLVDAPAYYPDPDRPPQDSLQVRSNGRTKIRSDRAEDVKHAIAGGVGCLTPEIEEVLHLATAPLNRRVTHLTLNNNKITTSGIERLFRLAKGHLEHFECHSMSLPAAGLGLPDWLSKSSRVHGKFGDSHLFRPVIASNLRSLCIHHSLVTQTPTLVAENVGRMTSLWLAETFLRERAELAFPQAYVPDMNPRLELLALAGLPRYSTGPLIDRLICFLGLAAKQERDIRQATVSSRRSPSMVRGLRRIRLEFEPDPSDELDSSTGDGEVDAGALMTSAADEFSFFDADWASSSDKKESVKQPAHGPSTEERRAAAQESDRLSHYPFSETQGEYVQHFGRWNGNDFTVPVWIGSGTLGPHRAVNEYMANLRTPALRADVRPASPSHVIAGVPAGSYIFSAAWNAMLACPDMRQPGKADLSSMRDVVNEIRTYRATTKIEHAAAQRLGPTGQAHLVHPHNHWTGTLEVVLKRNIGLS